MCLPQASAASSSSASEDRGSSQREVQLPANVWTAPPPWTHVCLLQTPNQSSSSRSRVGGTRSISAPAPPLASPGCQPSSCLWRHTGSQSALFPPGLQQQLMPSLGHQLDAPPTVPPSHPGQAEASSPCSQFPGFSFVELRQHLFLFVFVFLFLVLFLPHLDVQVFFCRTKSIFPTLVFSCESFLGFFKQIWELKEVVFLVSSCWLYKHSFTFYTLLGFSSMSTCA